MAGTWSAWRADVKARINLRDWVARNLGDLSADKVLCPFHEEKTPSCHVYPDHVHCFGCGQRGDIFDLLEHHHGLSAQDVLAEAARLAGVSLPNGSGRPVDNTANVKAPARKASSKARHNGEAQEQADWIDQLVSRAHAALLRKQSSEALAAWQYLEDRGLAGVAEILKLGVVDSTVQASDRRLRGRLLVPTLEGGRAIFYNARCIGDGEPKYIKPAKLTATAPYNPDALKEAQNLGWLVLAEGELDAASLIAAYGAGYPVIGLSGGLLPKGWADKIAAANLRQGVYIAFDSDASGRARAEKLQAELGGIGVKVHVLRLGTGHKDANEALQAQGTEALREALDLAIHHAALERTSDLLYIRDTWLAELDARANRPHAAYSTGVDKLDELLGGGYAEGLHLLGGITGGGKTSLALSIALHNALEGRPVLYGTYEQSRLELWARIASSLTGVPYLAIKRGTYDRHGATVLTSGELKASDGWGQLERAAECLKVVEGGDALSRTAGSYTVEVLATTAAAIAEDYGAPPLVILDYLQRMPVPAELKLRDTRERVSYVAGHLQVNLAREIGCPVLALSSLSRASYRLAEADSEGRLAAFKEAGELEYTSYTALLTYGLSEAVEARLGYSPGMLESHRSMTLDLVKNREGRPGRLAVKWKPAQDRWFDPAAYPEGR